MGTDPNPPTPRCDVCARCGCAPSTAVGSVWPSGCAAHTARTAPNPPTTPPRPPGHAVTQLRAPHRRVRDTRRVQARACAPPASACAAARPARPCRCAPTRHCGPGGSPTRGGRSGAERRPFTPHSAVCALPLGAEPPPPASPPLSQPFGGRWSGCRGVWAALTFLSLQPVPKLAENSRFCYFFLFVFPLPSPFPLLFFHLGALCSCCTRVH